MIRTGAFIVAGLGLAVPSMAWGQTAAPQSDDKRYTFNCVDEGYLRLDGRTGQVSICAQRPAGWACQAVPDERAALEAEIARLQAENAAVKKELIARNLPCLAPSNRMRRPPIPTSRACNCPMTPISTRS